MRPTRILHVAPTFYPATYYGGPIFSTYALCNALALRPDVSLRVLTSDAAGPDQRVPVSAYPIIYPAGYPVYFSRRIGRSDFSPMMIARLWRMIGWADAIHLTGVYSPPTLPTLAIARLRGKPVLWSTRGALVATHQWREAPRGRVKRWWEAACAAVMPKRTVLHATSEEEAAASTARLPGSTSVIIPNGADVPAELPNRTWMPAGVLKLTFIGRIHPIKGLDRLFDAMRLLPKGDVQLDIYGSGEPQHVQQLHEQAAGLESCVRFHGHVDGDQKARVFETADVCILPSYSENFGMSVAESLAYGVPVIVSTGAPWASVEPHGCGLWVDNAPASLANAITAIRTQDLAAMGLRGRAWMIEEFGWDSLADRTLATVNAMLIDSPGGNIPKILATKA